MHRTDQDGQPTAGVSEHERPAASVVHEVNSTASRTFILKDDDIAEWIEIQEFVRVSSSSLL